MANCETIIIGTLIGIEDLLIIVYLILIIIIGFKNIKYNKFNSNEIIKERILYEQISYEIYNSIKSNLLLDIKIVDYCENNYQPINFILKLNSNYNFKYNTNIYLINNFVFQFMKISKINIMKKN